MLVEKSVSSDNGSELVPASDKPPQQMPVIGPGAIAGPAVIYLSPIKAVETGVAKPEVVLVVGSDAQQATSSQQTPSLLATVTRTISRSNDSTISQFNPDGLNAIDLALLPLPRHLDQLHVDKLNKAVAEEMARGLPDNPTNADIVKRGEALVQIFKADKEKYTDFYVAAVKLAVAAYHKNKVLNDLAEAGKGVNSFDEINDDPVKTLAFDRTAHWIGVHVDEARIMNGPNIDRGIAQTHHIFDRLRMAIEVTNKYTPVATIYLMALCYVYRHETGNVIKEKFVFSPEKPEQIDKLLQGVGGIVTEPLSLGPTNNHDIDLVISEPIIHDRINQDVNVKDKQVNQYYFELAMKLIEGYYATPEIL